MLKLGIIDDDSQYLVATKNQILKFSKEKGIGIEVDVFSSGLAFITDYKPVYDIVLLDIEMPHMDGMEVARFIRRSNDHTLLIFITNMPQFAVKGYEVNAFDFMIKPIKASSFNLKLSAAIDALKQSNDITIQIPNEEGGLVLMAADIIYFEIRDHWLSIHTDKGDYQMLGSLKEMEEQLKDSHFIRCNKSCLINLQHVVRMRSDIVMLSGDHQLKISRARRKEVQFAFIDYYSGRSL